MYRVYAVLLGALTVALAGPTSGAPPVRTSGPSDGVAKPGARFVELWAPGSRSGVGDAWARAPVPAPVPTLTSKATGMKLVRVKAGKFRMGAPKDEKDRDDREGPQRAVEITKDFFLGTHEVTRGQFAQFAADTGHKAKNDDTSDVIGWNAAEKGFDRVPKFTWKEPGFAQTDEHPVVLVSWDDAVAFCAWLSKKDGRTYRLPSEAEWEFACRAGTTTRFDFGDDDEVLAQHGNSHDKETRAAGSWPVEVGVKASDGYAFTAPVGQFKPNAWGLYDMSGNAWEWCQDYYGEYADVPGARDPVQTAKQAKDRRILRGGGWFNAAHMCRSAYRYYGVPNVRHCGYGFRVCSTAD